ncbi:MAG: hypothetical protein IJ086_07425 [Clostridium sp.]|nr:hypothetical protein [Clostridium sp.]MBQ8998499.1 hypothetical protein [Clostridium sp.]
MTKLNFAISEIISNIDTIIIAVILYSIIRFLAIKCNKHSKYNKDFMYDDYISLDIDTDCIECECCDE